jgi:hypothetical protein
LATDELQMRAELSQVMSDLTDADLVFEVTAKPGRSAVIDSQAMQAIENAVKASVRAFADSFETRVERVAVLEEVFQNCLTVWFRFHAAESSSDYLTKITDPSLLKYAAQGLLTILNWMDGRSHLRLSDLHQAIRVLAWGTSATSCSRPAAPSSVSLVNAICAWQRVKEIFRESASAASLTMQQGSVELDLTKKIPKLRALLDKEVVNRAVEMILVVDLPDYGATGEWLLKHGQTQLTVQCGQCEVLERFYRRELDIRPGDALHCKVQFNTSYGPDHEVVDERLSVVEVLEVLSAPGTANEKAVFPDGQEVELKSVRELGRRLLVS